MNSIPMILLNFALMLAALCLKMTHLERILQKRARYMETKIMQDCFSPIFPLFHL